MSKVHLAEDRGGSHTIGEWRRIFQHAIETVPLARDCRSVECYGDRSRERSGRRNPGDVMIAVPEVKGALAGCPSSRLAAMPVENGGV